MRIKKAKKENYDLNISKGVLNKEQILKGKE